MTILPSLGTCFFVSFALAVGAGVPGTFAAAQDGVAAETGAESTLRARNGVAEIGRTWNVDAFAKTVQLYADVHSDIEWPGMLEPETFRYGPDSQQTLMLIRPEQEFSELSAVLLFMHGSGLEDSDQMTQETLDSASFIYRQVGQLGALFGGLGVTINYRTGERATARSGAEDLRLALEWVRENIELYGGDLNGVVLIADSWGATHAASYLFDETLHFKSDPGVAAAILSSGLFGEPAPLLESLVNDYKGSRVPLALWVAEYDTPSVEIGINEFYAQLCKKYGDCPALETIAGHNHVSHIMSFGTSDTTVQNAFIKFFHTSGADLD